MTIGEKYDVIYAEMKDGTFESEVQTLIKISTYEGKEIYIFRCDAGYDMATYNHRGNIDWDFMSEINDLFL